MIAFVLSMDDVATYALATQTNELGMDGIVQNA